MNGSTSVPTRGYELDPETDPFLQQVAQRFPVESAAESGPPPAPRVQQPQLREFLQSDELEKALAAEEQVLLFVYHVWDRQQRWVRELEEYWAASGAKVWAVEGSVVPSLTRRHQIRLLPVLCGFRRGQFVWQRPMSASVALEVMPSAI